MIEYKQYVKELLSASILATFTSLGAAAAIFLIPDSFLEVWLFLFSIGTGLIAFATLGAAIVIQFDIDLEA